MRKIYFGDFRVYVIQHVKEIEKQNIEPYTTEWFLLRYLKRVIKNTESISLPRGRVESSMRGFVRFYVDMVDEKSELGDRCVKIYEEYRKTVLKYQSKKQ